MWVEITEAAFKAIVSQAAKCSKACSSEFAVKYYYFEQGCELLMVNNFLSCTFQYYICDINA